MRLWSVHPSYLDVQGLSGLWRETLLAKKVLSGLTKGYKNHPQLNRFKNHKKSLVAINCYLFFIWTEADKRGYSFDRTKISETLDIGGIELIDVNQGQVQYEFSHLMKKIKERSPEWYGKLNIKESEKKILIHPIFKQVSGGIEAWEKLS
jgi:hypothetical protein